MMPTPTTPIQTASAPVDWAAMIPPKNTNAIDASVSAVRRFA